MLFSREIVDLFMGDDLHDMLDVREPRVTCNSPGLQGLLAACGHPHPAPVPAVCAVCLVCSVCSVHSVLHSTLCSVNCARVSHYLAIMRQVSGL